MRRNSGADFSPVSLGEAAILGKQQPGAEAHDLAKHEKKPQGEEADEGGSRAVEEINAEIEHAGPASRSR
jgi:hypothetical protein